ncbi:MAG: hypothetical protein KAX28_13290 [Candidatus Marinimicrobia bacterium]|nr:hypothetical protein [Candidatus Neomarinimicrobiota bacterium]
MVTRQDYTQEAVDGCLSVMVEIMTILGEFRDYIVLVGGWVPYFLLPEKKEDHTGSMDIDLALDHEHITDDSYRTILQLLDRHGYKESEKQPFIFFKEIQIDDARPLTVEIDFLSAEYGGTSNEHRTQNVQGIRARKARGSDLAFSDYSKIKVSARMPDGAVNEVSIKVSNVVPFIVMKGMALWKSPKEKHPYDIYFIISNYTGGLDSIVKTFKPYLGNKLVLEGLGKIKKKFETPGSIGPTWIANFESHLSEEDKDLLRRDAFERVKAFLDQLNIEAFED